MRSQVMKMLLLSVLAGTLFLAACSHMEGVVKEVRLNQDGNLVITKCDEKLYWNFYFVVWGESNCREEVKPRPSTPHS